MSLLTLQHGAPMVSAEGPGVLRAVGAKFLSASGRPGRPAAPLHGITVGDMSREIGCRR